MDYNTAKRLWESVKPIRGRSEDVRPAGKRRKDEELICARPQPNGTTAYAYRLHQTDVVTYYADNAVALSCNGWAPRTTTKFMQKHSPFRVRRIYNKIWVYAYGVPYNVPNKGSLLMKLGEAGYTPATPVILKKKVVDRKLAAEARKPYLPFLRWAKTFHALSDGWIMHETRREVIPFNQSEGEPFPYFKYETVPDAKRMLEWIAASGEDDYLKILCHIFRQGGFHSRNYQHARFSYIGLQHKIYGMVQHVHDTYRVVETEPGPRPIKGLVD